VAGCWSKNNVAKFDADYLFSLAREKSKASRSTLAEIVTELFREQSGALTERERMLMFDILHSVVRDMELALRRNISEEIAEHQDLPRSLALLLANDRFEVAFPILSKSRVLEDTDLIEIIRGRTLEHQLAVAAREGISEIVSAALVATKIEPVVQTLLKNQDAKISSETMEYLVDQSRRVDSFQEPILRRNEMPDELAKRMFMWVSAALRQFIVSSFKLDDATVDDLLEKAALHHGMETRLEKPAERLVESLAERNAISHEMLVVALEEGQVDLFVALFARLTGLRDRLVRRLLFEPGGEGLGIACKAVGFDRSAYSQIFSRLSSTQPDRRKNFLMSHKLALEFFDNMSESAATAVLTRWRRDPKYLGAIRDIEGETKGRRGIL
jgi:uncharacterized protein (DUF2336 family)